MERYVYDAYGAVSFANSNWSTFGTSSTANNTVLYTGRELDPESGLWYYRARYYSADLGRFIGRDPIGYGAEDYSLYRYVGNAPVDYVDPFGLVEKAPGGAHAARPKLGKPRVSAGVPIAECLGLSPRGRSGLVQVNNGTAPAKLARGTSAAWTFARPQPSKPVAAKARSKACNGYDKYIGSKCCRSNWFFWCEEVEDPYPAKAKVVCQRFLDLYEDSRESVCVAECLTGFEELYANICDCGERNRYRLNAHIWCYASCMFLPTRGLPEEHRRSGGTCCSGIGLRT